MNGEKTEIRKLVKRYNTLQKEVRFLECPLKTAFKEAKSNLYDFPLHSCNSYFTEF